MDNQLEYRIDLPHGRLASNLPNIVAGAVFALGPVASGAFLIYEHGPNGQESFGREIAAAQANIDSALAEEDLFYDRLPEECVVHIEPLANELFDVNEVEATQALLETPNQPCGDEPIAARSIIRRARDARNTVFEGETELEDKHENRSGHLLFAGFLLTSVFSVASGIASATAYTAVDRNKRYDRLMRRNTDFEHRYAKLSSGEKERLGNISRKQARLILKEGIYTAIERTGERHDG